MAAIHPPAPPAHRTAATPERAWRPAQGARGLALAGWGVLAILPFVATLLTQLDLSHHLATQASRAQSSPSVQQRALRDLERPAEPLPRPSISGQPDGTARLTAWSDALGADRAPPSGRSPSSALWRYASAVGLLSLLIAGTWSWRRSVQGRQQRLRLMRRMRQQRRQDRSHQAAQLEAAVIRRTAELTGLSTYLHKHHEHDKAQLARDLHDEFGALLTAAKLDVAWLQACPCSIDTQQHERLARLSAELDAAVDWKRRMIEQLRPSLLEHLGLSEALAWHVQESCRAAGLRHTLNLADIAVEPELGLMLYRIVQETLRHLIQHAQADQITVELSLTPSQGLQLILEGDGRGGLALDPEVAPSLASMQHRVQSHGGTLGFDEQPGQRTRLTVMLPGASGKGKPRT